MHIGQNTKAITIDWPVSITPRGSRCVSSKIRNTGSNDNACRFIPSQAPSFFSFSFHWSHPRKESALFWRQAQRSSRRETNCPGFKAVQGNVQKNFIQIIIIIGWDLMLLIPGKKREKTGLTTFEKAFVRSWIVSLRPSIQSAAVWWGSTSPSIAKRLKLAPVVFNEAPLSQGAIRCNLHLYCGVWTVDGRDLSVTSARWADQTTHCAHCCCAAVERILTHIPVWWHWGSLSQIAF